MRSRRCVAAAVSSSWSDALQDGDMAGLDGLETVGLDCWEGFGTASMGRL